MTPCPQAALVFVFAAFLSSCSADPKMTIQGPGHRLRHGHGGEEIIRDPTAFLTRPDMEAMRRHSEAPREVSVPIRMSRGVPVMDAALNNEVVPLILDTGCQPALVVDQSAAAWMKVRVLRSAPGRLVLKGALGTETALLGRVQRLNLSGWRLEDVPCLIRPPHTDAGAASLLQRMPMNLFGMALPLHACSYLTIDYPQGRAIFGFQKPYVPGRGKSAWHVPLIMRDGTPHVSLSCGGVTWEALVDTGTTAGVTITPQIVRRCGVTSSLTGTDMSILGVGAASSAGSSRIRRAALPGIHGLGPELQDLTVNVASYSPRVGSQLLSRYRVTLDFQRQRLWLEE